MRQKLLAAYQRLSPTVFIRCSLMIAGICRVGDDVSVLTRLVPSPSRLSWFSRCEALVDYYEGWCGPPVRAACLRTRPLSSSCLTLFSFRSVTCFPPTAALGLVSSVSSMTYLNRLDHVLVGPPVMLISFLLLRCPNHAHSRSF